MFYDIVFPKNNETEFIQIAEKLVIEGLCFTYPFLDKKKVTERKNEVEKLQKNTKVILKTVFLASGNKIYKVHDFKEIAVAEGSEDSRDVIARLMPDVVYDVELSKRKDFAKSRNSGLDKAICQFANKNNTIVAFPFSNILNTANLPLLLGRIRQNIKLCKKYNVKTAIASFASDPYQMRSPHELRSLLSTLGMYTLNAKQSIESISKLFD